MHHLKIKYRYVHFFRNYLLLKKPNLMTNLDFKLLSITHLIYPKVMHRSI